MVWDGPMSNVLGLPLLGVLGSLYRPSPPAVPSARFDLKRAPPRAPPQHARRTNDGVLMRSVLDLILDNSFQLVEGVEGQRVRNTWRNVSTWINLPPCEVR